MLVVAAFFIGGLALFILQNPRSTEPMVVLNAFMQVLPVSIAEVLVCWTLVGSSFESLSRRRGKITSVLIGAIGASVFFGLYHYAHSAPFNETSTVLFLMLPSIATAITYFLSRNICAAIMVQNFLGITGVIANLPNLEPFRQPMIPVYAVSAVSVAVLVISVSVVLRRAITKIGKRRKDETNNNPENKAANGDVTA